MSDDKDASVASFEHLPVEILAEIFTFLSLPELVKAFCNLNSYIDSIIQSVNTVKYMVMVRYNETVAINLLRFCPAAIVRLTIIHATTVDLTSLINLRSLTLKYGTHIQFNSIRPQYFSKLKVLHLYAIILSNGFPQLQKCTAVRLGDFEYSETWTGSPALRYLHLNMKTEYDRQKLLLLCPNLELSTTSAPIGLNLSNGNLHGFRRLLTELSKIEQLEAENKFILDYFSKFLLRCDEPPPRFNNTVANKRYHKKDAIIIQGRILPKTEPYCRASFLIEITLPLEYPFKIPNTVFIDPIYHPNIDNDGYSCCCFEHFLPGETWRSTTSIATIIETVIDVIDTIPSNGRSLNIERAQEYEENRQKFYDNALNLTLTYGRPRY
ncbi:hypothetical protein I4U23_021992 [Adineta vaga]|nr:hypothetical protein I4U23_021992 [Adineta vaga]